MSSPRPSEEMPTRPGWTLAIISIALFMTALDNLVVGVALPSIRVDLGGSIEALEWTVNAYTLAFAVLLITGAALGDRFGRKRMFAIGLSTFTAASAMAALSPSVAMLVTARAIQGAGAAIVFPLTLTLISEAFPAEKRGAAIGLWGGITGLGVAIGPVIGGAVVSGISWHWIFWLNVPVGIAVVPLALRRLTESFGPRPQLDVVGCVLAAAGALGITWGLVRAAAVGWGSVEVIGAMAAGAGMLGAFLAWERHWATASAGGACSPSACRCSPSRRRRRRCRRVWARSCWPGPSRVPARPSCSRSR